MKKLLSAKFYLCICVLVYLIFTVLVPPNQAVLHQYRLSAAQARMLSVAIVVPVILIWLVAYYGYFRLVKYSHRITDPEERKQITGISLGVGILALGSPTTTVLGSILNLVGRNHAQLLTTTTIVNTYLSLVVPFIAFLLIGSAARSLANQIKRRPPHIVSNLIIAAFAVISVVYCYLIFSNHHIDSVYKLKLLPLTLTVVLPYVFMWYTGLLAVVDLTVFSTKIKGILYRRSWQIISAGFAVIILSTITIQYVTTLTVRLLKLKAGPLMLVLYLLIILISVGYVLIAKGAKQLQKMEEV